MIRGTVAFAGVLVPSLSLSPTSCSRLQANGPVIKVQRSSVWILGFCTKAVFVLVTLGEKAHRFRAALQTLTVVFAKISIGKLL